MKKVSLFHFSEESLDKTVEDGFREIGLNKAIKHANTVCIKPNLVTDVEEYIKNGANTDLRVIEAVLKYLSKFKVKVFIGESDTGTSLKGRKLSAALHGMGVSRLQEKYDFDIINFSKEESIEVFIPNANFLKKVRIAKVLNDVDLIINLPKVKTHKYSTITCALKNMFGVVPDPLRIRYHENIHNTVADLSSLFMSKTFVLTDAIVAMEGKGPIYGKPVLLNALIFSNSMLANDLVACKIMQFNPNEVLHIQHTINMMQPSDCNYVLNEHMRLSKISRPFLRSEKNLYVVLEGKLMQFESIINIVYSQWFQRNISYRLRKILKFARGGSYSWYYKGKKSRSKIYIDLLDIKINWRKALIYFFSYLQGSRRMLFYNKIIGYCRLDEKESEKMQEKKLEKLLIHAYKNVPFYKEILENAKVVTSEGVFLENFEKIPILTKDIIRSNYEDLKSVDMKFRRPFTNHSGGSTGEPLEFVQDRYYDDWNIANKLFYKHLGGQEIGNREMRLWGSEKDFVGDRENILVRLRNYIFNRKDLNAFSMTESNMFKYINEINDFKPTWIEGYVQPLYELALFVEKKGLKVYSPKGILTSAGTLYPELQRKIEDIFNCKVWNRYGSREVGDIAFGRDKLDISFWNNKVEIIQDTGVMGKIIITNLNNYSFPFIRYDIGDIASQIDSKRQLTWVEGREMSVIRNRNGKIIPGEFFIHFIGVVVNNGGIRKFQVIQEDYEHFRIKILIGNKKLFYETKGAVENLIDMVMEYKCNITWESVKSIENLSSGKYLYIISKV